MTEPTSPDIKIFGLPQERHDSVKVAALRAREDSAQEKLAKLSPAKLSHEQRAQFSEIDTAADQFIFLKMTRLGIPEDKFPVFQPANYIHRPKHAEGDTGGTFSRVSRIVSVYEKNPMMSFFDILSITAHEKSHASVGQEVRFYFPNDESISSFATSQGAELVGNHQTLGEAIEEGLTIADEVDFFNLVLKDKYPVEYDKRIKWVQDYKIKRVIDSLDPKVWGNITPELIAPFIIEAGPRMFGRPILPTPVLSTLGSLKEYLFSRKLCELIGKDELGIEDESKTETEEVIQAGRDILDKDRYLRTHDAHRRIVKILGGEKAKALFQFKAHDPNIDQAMGLLVS